MTPHRPHKGIIIAALCLLLGFFLPWVSTPLGDVTPFNMLVGYAGDIFGGVQNVLWLMPICAVLLLFNEFTSTAPLRGFERLLKVLPLLAWALFTLVLYNKASQFGGSGTGDFVLKALGQVVQGGFYLTMAGVLWLFLLSFASRAQFTPAAPVVYMVPQPALPQAYVPVAPMAPVAPVAPTVPAGPNAAELFGAWLSRNAKLVGATMALLLVSWSVYAFFLKANPQADGKKIATAYCDCEKDYLTAQQKAKQEYLDAHNPGTSIKAQLVAALATIGDSYTKCRQHAKELESDKRSSFIGDDVAKVTFDNALTEQLGLWYSAEAENVAKLNQTLLAQGFTRQSLTPVASQLRYQAQSPTAADSLANSIEIGPQADQAAVTSESSAANVTNAYGTESDNETEGSQGVVNSAKAYFYTTADLSERRKAYCVRGDKLVLGTAVGRAVQATYTSATGKAVTGWVNKNDLNIEPSGTQDAAASDDTAGEGEDAANGDLVGTWKGTLGGKPFTLNIEAANGNTLTGWNQVDDNRRPITGTFTDVQQDGSSIVFELALREPGTDKWDGRFDLTLASPMSKAAPTYCSGTWYSFQGGLQKDVEARKVE